MIKASNLYVKYVVNSSLSFCLCILIGIAVFATLAQSIKTDITETCSAVISDGKIVAEADIEVYTNSLYVYSDRNDKIVKVVAKNTEHTKDGVAFILREEDVEKLSGFQSNVSVDIVTGRQSLLHQVMIKAGKR